VEPLPDLAALLIFRVRPPTHRATATMPAPPRPCGAVRGEAHPSRGRLPAEQRRIPAHRGGGDAMSSRDLPM